MATQTIGNPYGAFTIIFVAANTMQEKVHDTKSRGIVYDLPAIERIMLQETFLIGVQLVMFNDIVMRSKQNPAPDTNNRNALEQSGKRSWKNSTLVESGYYCSSDKTYYFIKNLTILSFTDTSS